MGESEKGGNSGGMRALGRDARSEGGRFRGSLLSLRVYGARAGGEASWRRGEDEEGRRDETVLSPDGSRMKVRLSAYKPRRAAPPNINPRPSPPLHPAAN